MIMKRNLIHILAAAVLVTTGCSINSPIRTSLAQITEVTAYAPET